MYSQQSIFQKHVGVAASPCLQGHIPILGWYNSSYHFHIPVWHSCYLHKDHSVTLQAGCKIVRCRCDKVTQGRDRDGNVCREQRSY